MQDDSDEIGLSTDDLILSARSQLAILDETLLQLWKKTGNRENDGGHRLSESAGNQYRRAVERNFRKLPSTDEEIVRASEPESI